MVFYADLDPAVITQACESQPYGYQCLIAMLRGFVQNCCLIDRNGEVSAALAGRVRGLPSNSDRKTLETILEFLNEHCRFIDETNEADVIITKVDRDNGSSRDRNAVEICSLASYQFTNFEQHRSLSAHGGVMLGFGTLSAEDLFETHFLRALRHARWVQICDGSLGENFKPNYRYTVEQFLVWLRRTSIFGDGCNVSFKCLAPFREEDRRDRSLRPNEWRLDEQKCAELKTFFAEQRAPAEFYRFLPHDRFVCTDQFALEIGRGMDFLEPKRGRSRDLSIATKDLRQVTGLLNDYARNQLPGI